MSKCCAWLNIVINTLVGSAAAFGGLILAVLCIGFGGSPAEVLVVAGPLIVGGLLYASSGVILWWSRPSVSSGALIVQGLAVLFGLAYCLTMFGSMEEYDPYDEEHRLFLALPALGVLLVGIQLVCLFSKWLRKDECRPGEDTTADESGLPKVKRRWYQFSTRTLIKVAVVSIVAVVWIGSMANDRRIVSELRKLGPATVFYAWGYVETIHLDGRNRNTDAALERLKGLARLRRLSLSGVQYDDSSLEHIQRMSSLRVLTLQGTRVTDAGLARLQGLTKLECLTIDRGETVVSAQPVTDAGLAHLRELTNLQRLELYGMPITDVGLESLKGLTKLRGLTLLDTQITDAGLEHLKGLTNLASLNLNCTQVTDKGVARLKESLPNCRIEY